MALSLVSLTFQGEPSVVGALDPADLHECQREAFPRSPPRNATSDPGYRAHKLAPLRGGRLLVSVVSNRGQSDAHGRPVLTAMTCVLDRAAMSGPARDLAAVWSVLEGWEPGRDLPAFETAVAARSIWSAEAAFATFRRRLTEDAAFQARAAIALTRPRVNVAWAPGDDVSDTFATTLALLPAKRLFGLELATASVDDEGREAILGVAGLPKVAPEERSTGLLGGLLARRKSTGAIVIDFRSRAVGGESDPGPVEVIQAIIDGASWPGISDAERFRLIMTSVDSSWLQGRPSTPFDLSPDLESLRKTIRQIEQLSRRLETWR